MTSVSPDSSSTLTADPFSGRAVPWSQEAEQAVLGAMIIDGDAALRAAELLDDRCSTGGAPPAVPRDA